MLFTELQNFDLMPILHQKILENDNICAFPGFFLCKIGIKSKVDNIFEKKCSRFFAFMYRSYVPNFSQIGLQMQK